MFTFTISKRVSNVLVLLWLHYALEASQDIRYSWVHSTCRSTTISQPSLLNVSIKHPLLCCTYNPFQNRFSKKKGITDSIWTFMCLVFHDETVRQIQDDLSTIFFLNMYGLLCDDLV